MLGSAGCQPAAFGRLPNAWLPHKLRSPRGSRQAAANYRPAACAPQNTRDKCATRNQPDWTILHNKFPPTLRVGLVWPWPHRPALILLFAKKFFRLQPGSLIPDAAISATATTE